MKFLRLTDRKSIDLIPYLKEYVQDRNGDVRIYLGCDSQNKRYETVYATTIVIHVGNLGCHVLYRRETINRIGDFWTRLWGEVERSVELALFLQNNGIEVDNIDLDLNSDPSKKSNKLVQAARGYVESAGIKARIKPEILPAICAADNLVK